MPRLLSSYAANKRVEDGLKRKQEQIRQEYVRARHRYLDETEKLINDLIQIHVKTPSAFRRATPPNSAPSYNRPGRGGVFPSQAAGVQLPHHLTSQQQQQTTAEILQQTSNALGCRSNGEPGATGIPALPVAESNRVAGGGSRSAPVRRVRAAQAAAATTTGATTTATSGGVAPQPPVVQIRGDEVFYQYNTGRPSGWKKVEPAYRTKVLLHRNNTVSQALLKQQQQQQQHESGTTDATDITTSTSADGSTTTSTHPPPQRRGSVYSAVARRDSELYARRDSLFSSRRGSRRGSRFFEEAEEDLEEDERASRLASLMQQQLSPGHTPRMLDGWTIMNWCLWNKRSEKPVWATKRFMEKKRRELKKYEASRMREKKERDLPAKPLSAKEGSRENRRHSSVAEEDKALEPRRAKSVPLHSRNNSRLEGVDEEDEEEGKVEEADQDVTESGTKTLPRIPEPPDRGILRPTTSILRSSRLDSERDDTSRPKTTHPRRRVVLGAFIQQDGLPSFRGSTDAERDQSHSRSRANSEDNSENNNMDSQHQPSHRPAQRKHGEKEGGSQRKRTISINECPQVVSGGQQGPQTPRSSASSLVLSRTKGERADLEERMPGLAATRIATSTASQSINENGLRKSGAPPRKASGVSKKVNTATAGTVIFPKVRQLVPELGTDSPR